MRFQNKKVSGTLLYAKTNKGMTFDNNYLMSGNQISVKTLDLNVEFNDFRRQLNLIAENYFEIKRY